MAEAGFYYTGSESSPDAVCCVVCQHELDGWEEGDCPLAEHRRHSPTCPFLKVKDPNHLTVREVIKLERKALQLIIVSGGRCVQACVLVCQAVAAASRVMVW